MIEENFEEIEEESKWKKILIIFIGLILLFLFLSYILVSYPLFSIIASLSESQVAENKTIILDEFSIIFTGNTYEQLQKYYTKDLSVEMAVCLKGKIKEDYMIDEIYQPKIVEQTYEHVTYRPCDSETIIHLHSQPFRRCIASEQDLITLDLVKQVNNQSIMVIMCEPDRFSVYK